MGYNELLEFDRLVVSHFEERKKHDKLKNKDEIKYHKAEIERYDNLALEEIHKLDYNIGELYGIQVTKENSRALRSTRYYNYRKWETRSIKEKERWAIDIIKEGLKRAEKPVVSSSFGIDSIVTLYLTRKALVELGRDPSDIEVVWCDTLNEFPEVRLFAKRIVEEWNLNLIIYKPKKPLKKIINEHGGVDSSYFFTRKGDRRNGRPLSEKCCGTLKHEPMKRAIKENRWDLQINGVRADESTQRKLAGLRDGEYFYSSGEWKAFSCRPLLWWMDDDVWDYVEQENIPFVDVYNKNLIREYPSDLDTLIEIHRKQLLELGFDIEALKNQEIQSVIRRKQVNFLMKIGFRMFPPRVGCMVCPIPVKFGYMQWMRMYYPKVFKTMIHNLEYGKALLDMIPDDAKEEITFALGIDLNEENAHEYLTDILQAKPCVFDKFD